MSCVGVVIKVPNIAVLQKCLRPGAYGLSSYALNIKQNQLNVAKSSGFVIGQATEKEGVDNKQNKNPQQKRKQTHLEVPM